MARRHRVSPVAALTLAALALVGAGGLALAWRRAPPKPTEGGRAAYERRDWSAASEWARRALKGRPDDREALRLLARSAGRLGRDESALAIFRRLGEDGMGAEDHLVVAGGLQRQGRLAEAYQ